VRGEGCLAALYTYSLVDACSVAFIKMPDSSWLAAIVLCVLLLYPSPRYIMGLAGKCEETIMQWFIVIIKW